MGMFEMSDRQAAEWEQKCRELVAPQVDGEEVVSAAAFRQGGASANYLASKAQLGGLVYAGVAAAPQKLYAYKLKVGRHERADDRVARRGREGDAGRGRGQGRPGQRRAVAGARERRGGAGGSAFAIAYYVTEGFGPQP